MLGDLNCQSAIAFLMKQERSRQCLYAAKTNRRDRSLGGYELAKLIERTCRHAKHFAQELKAAGYPILNDVVLNQVLVSFGDAETTHRIITHADVEKSLAAMLGVAGKYCSPEF